MAEKLKREGRNEIFEQETMEELEDEESGSGGGTVRCAMVLPLLVLYAELVNAGAGRGVNVQASLSS